MPQNELKETLRSLHAELSSTPDLDPEARALLTRLAEDIEDVLHPAAPPPEPRDESLFDQVTGLGKRFEESHPKLAAVIGRVAEGLSQLGI
jgi:hypothetical protein